MASAAGDGGGVRREGGASGIAPAPKAKAGPRKPPGPRTQKDLSLKSKLPELAYISAHFSQQWKMDYELAMLEVTNSGKEVTMRLFKEVMFKKGWFVFQWSDPQVSPRWMLRSKEGEIRRAYRSMRGVIDLRKDREPGAKTPK